MDQATNQLKLKSLVEIQAVFIFQALKISYLQSLSQTILQIFKQDFMLQFIIVSQFQKVDVLKEEINFNNLQLTVLLSRMENLDSAIVTLVQKMKDIVFLMMTAWMVFHVDQSIANTWMALKVMWSVVTIQHQEMKISVLLKILVRKVKETVI